jgi:hypothetical protein
MVIIAALFPPDSAQFLHGTHAALVFIPRLLFQKWPFLQRIGSVAEFQFLLASAPFRQHYCVWKVSTCDFLWRCVAFFAKLIL